MWVAVASSLVQCEHKLYYRIDVGCGGQYPGPVLHNVDISYGLELMWVVVPLALTIYIILLIY